MYIQGVTDRTDFWNNFCSNQYLNFFYMHIIYSFLRYTYIKQKNIFTFNTENKKF